MVIAYVANALVIEPVSYVKFAYLEITSHLISAVDTFLEF